MSNKRLQISTDNTTWNTFPGDQAAKKVELNGVADTVFGQSYGSTNVTLGQSDYSGNSFFKGIAGYNAIIQKTGTATTMTAEPTTLVSGKTYQITASAKRLISINDTLTVLDNSVNQTANVSSIDYLTGQVTFLSSYSVTGPVTVTGKYLPLSTMAKAKSWTLTQTQTEIDASDYDDAQANSGMRTFLPGLKNVKLQLGSIYNATNAYIAALQTRALCYLQADLEGATNAGMEVWRGMFHFADHNQQGNQGALEDETVSFDLYVPPSSLLLQPFGWYLNSSSLMSTAIQQAINAWQNQTTIYVRYLPTGAPGASPLDGWTSQAIVTEASITNDAVGQNVFTFKFRATGAITNC